jgi:rod shape-determining protein MreD
MNEYLKIGLRFCLIILIQVLILNRVLLGWWTEPAGFPIFIPMLYPLFILILPFETPVWLLLILGFATGITMDAFTNTAGIHAMATVLIAYLRTNILTFLMPRPLTEYAHLSPSVKTMNWLPFLSYCSLLLLLHHTVFFSMEVWNFKSIGLLLLKIGASCITSVLLMAVYSLLFANQRT